MLKRLILLFLAATAAAYAAVGTPRGSRFLARAALVRFAGTPSVSIASAEGSLVTGLTLHGLRVRNAKRLPHGSVIRATQAWVPPIAWPDLIPKALSLSGVEVLAPGAAGFIGAESVEAGGERLNQWRIEGLRVRDIPGRLAEAELLIQRVEASWPGLPRLAVEPRSMSVFNGRFRVGDGEPLLVYGRFDEGRLGLRVYAHTMAARDVLQLLPRGEVFRDVTGTVRDFDGTVQGTLGAPELSAHFSVEQLAHRGFSMMAAPGRLTLRPSFKDGRTLLTGEIAVERGVLKARETAITLHPSRLTFTGPPADPSLDIAGHAQIQRVRIDLRLAGTRRQPELRLVSDPPLAEWQLLAMLATGRRWKGTEAVLERGQVSPQLAGEFLDYFLFAGLGQRFAHRLGLDDVTLTYDAERRAPGFGVSVGDMDASYELDPSQELSGPVATVTIDPSAVTHKLGAEYHVSERTSLQLGVEKQVIPSVPAQTTETAEESADSLLLPNDRVELKVKRRF